MDYPNFDELLNRYQRGETSVTENEQVEIWLAKMKPEDTQWNHLDNTGRELWITELRNDIQKSIRSKTVVPSRSVRIIQWRKLTAAAALIAIIFYVTINWTSIKDKIEARNFSTLNVSEHQTKRILLPDGSTVWINASSELQYPKSFDGKTREVHLTGEAYFDIQHQQNKPFIVRTGNITTTVLGTAFNIKALKAANRIIVTVTRGKVGVADQNHLLAYVTPNQQLIYHISKADNEKLTVDAQKTISWRDDLYFDDTTFEEAAKRLEQRFNVRIAFANENIKGCRFSGTALGDKSLDEILTMICAINQAGYSKNSNGQFIITGNGCK
ncbi:FecR family protein [Pedobacter sp. GR22-10]|uniref:FecR family protein n=1 Tax=Pedobacter TaxID=84567 RepID=UPI002247AD4C|nr:FecR domain-containing protein [Pedobacter sp. GR22-10]MCX2430477.1 FecR domain-containing protein [Pedobacter sp. GR22-10]